MRRLWVRLTLAFVLVVLVTVVAIALPAHRNLGAQFRYFLTEPDLLARSGLLDQLTEFYQQHGSWQGVKTLLTTAQPGPTQANRVRRLLLLTDLAYIILYDGLQQRQGETLTATEAATAQAILVQEQVVGYGVLQTPPLTMLDIAEQRFLLQLRRLLLIGALIAGGVGILLGAVISRTLAAPLDQLAIQARAFATRDWSRRVAIRNQLNISEVAAVAHAFNHMADSLQQAETVRRHLVADIAHELRTPLTVLQGNLRALLDGVYPLEMSEIASLYDETTLLARLVDDLRQLALAEAGQLPLTCQPLTVIDLLQTTAERYTVAAEAKAITLTVTLPPTLPPVYADSDRVAQVLHNLISNALRHTPSGGKVVLAAAIQPGAVKISIQDNGEGIDPAALPHVFDRFYRPTAQGEQHNDGSGLGLTIAKTLVEAMGGAIGVESQAGLGACFWFTLPQAQAFDSHCSPSAMQ